MSNLLMYETYYDKLQPYFDKKIYNYILFMLIASY